MSECCSVAAGFGQRNEYGSSKRQNMPPGTRYVFHTPGSSYNWRQATSTGKVGPCRRQISTCTSRLWTLTHGDLRCGRGQRGERKFSVVTNNYHYK